MQVEEYLFGNKTEASRSIVQISQLRTKTTTNSPLVA